MTRRRIESRLTGLPQEIMDGLYVAIFKGLVTVGFKVVIGVTGHDVEEQVASLQKAVEAIGVAGQKAQGLLAGLG